MIVVGENTIKGGILIKDLNQNHIESYKSQIILEKASPVTINIEFRTFKSLFNYAVGWSLLEKNPCKGVKQFSIPQKERLAFIDYEVNMILSTISEDFVKNIVIFALNTGCRINEILFLQWRDVDIKERIITIRNKANFKTKTGQIRYIPISDTLLSLLQSLLSPLLSLHDNNNKYRNNEKHCNNNEGLDYEKYRESYVFQKEDGMPYLKDHISKHFKQHLKKLNLSNKYHFHSLRHTFITQLARKGVNIYDIKQLAGHSDIKTTELYMHNITDDLRKAVNLLNFNIQ